MDLNRECTCTSDIADHQRRLGHKFREYPELCKCVVNFKAKVIFLQDSANIDHLLRSALLVYYGRYLRT